MSDAARGLAIGARRLGMMRGLARLDGADAAAARSLLDGGGVIEAVDDPRPRGWRAIDPSWIEAAIGDEGEAVRAIVLSDRDDPIARWLARWAFDGLVAMPAAGPVTRAGELPKLAAPILARALSAIGVRQLAHAIGGAAASEHAALAARLPWGARLAGEIAAVRSLGEAAAAQLGSRRSAALRTADLAWDDPGAPLFAGLRAVGPSVRGEVGRQIAQRLPYPIGVRARDELARFASEPADPVADAEVQRAVAQRGAAMNARGPHGVSPLVPFRRPLILALLLFAACSGDDGVGPDAAVDAPTVDAAIDAPDIDAPDVDAPAIDAPAIDAPAVDAPEIDAPAIDAAAIDAPAVDAPAIDAPAIDAAIDAPVIDAPAIDAPAVDAPAIDAPAIDAPAIDAPAIDAAIDAPAIDAPAIDAPAIDAPIDAPAIDAPTDAMPVVGAITVTTEKVKLPPYSTVPLPGVTVLAINPDGTDGPRGITDAAGNVTLDVIAGSTVVAVFSHPTNTKLDGVAGVEPGDHLVFLGQGEEPSGDTLAGTFQYAWPTPPFAGLVAFADRCGYRFAVNPATGMPMPSPFTVNLVTRCVGPSKVLAQISGSAGSVYAYSPSANLVPGGSHTFPAWTPMPTLTATLTGVAPGTTLGGEGLGVFEGAPTVPFYGSTGTAPVGGTSTYTMAVPGGLETLLLTTNILNADSTYGRVSSTVALDPGTTTFARDLATQPMLPAMTWPVANFQRTMISWNQTAGATADGIKVVLNYGNASWHLLVPPGATSYSFPRLPADLAYLMPAPGAQVVARAYQWEIDTVTSYRDLRNFSEFLRVFFEHVVDRQGVRRLDYSVSVGSG